jgi:6-phosphogluconate dehydrogenase
MGQNLVLNMNDHGYKVAVFNRTVSQGRRIHRRRGQGNEVVGATRSRSCAGCSRSPPRHAHGQGRRGRGPIHRALLPFSRKATSSSTAAIRSTTTPNAAPRPGKEKGILFVGTGVSGGEEGARHGPSIMPGGNPGGVAARQGHLPVHRGQGRRRHPCCDWVGEGGAGHYVKMVHNGIEYGDMQLIGEAYSLLKDGLGPE